jgi:hypothetical protein
MTTLKAESIALALWQLWELMTKYCHFVFGSLASVVASPELPFV